MRIGILGNGQLARLLMLAGKSLGIDFTFYGTSPNRCTDSLGVGFYGPMDLLKAIKPFADGVDVLTLENENIPKPTLMSIAEHKLYPAAKATCVAQDRLIEKQFIEQLDIPLADYYAIHSEADLSKAFERCQNAIILKTRHHGYDGKGQMRIDQADAITAAWQSRTSDALIAESLVEFKREIAIIAVRDRYQRIGFYPVTENIHHNGILHTALVRPNDPLQAKAEGYTRRLMEALDYVGVLGFEFFDCDGKLLANEFAPRVHNTGHWSIDGASCSQFENHIRVISDLPMGCTEAEKASVMFNVIGQWPDLKPIMKLPGVHVHHYQKEPQPNRKIGHINVTADSQKQLADVSRHVQAVWPMPYQGFDWL